MTPRHEGVGRYHLGLAWLLCQLQNVDILDVLAHTIDDLVIWTGPLHLDSRHDKKKKNGTLSAIDNLMSARAAKVEVGMMRSEAT